MIEMLANSIVGKLSSVAGEYAFEELKAAKSAKHDLAVMAEKMEAICAVIKDAEEKGYMGDNNKQPAANKINLWLRKLKSLSYDIDDLLDEVAFDAKLRKANEGHPCRQLRYYVSPSNPIILRFCLSHKIKDLREKLENIATAKDQFNLSEHHPGNSSGDDIQNPLDQCAYVLDRSVAGRDKAKQDILDKVYSGSDAAELSVLPVVGKGGIGKTTVAKLVHRDVQNFDLKLWARASSKFHTHRIIEDIVKDGTRDNTQNQRFNELVKKLHLLLSRNKFFLVLDNVWVDDLLKWWEFRNLLAVGKEGSVILITTREERVASVTKENMEPYHLNPLSDQICLSIFTKIAFPEGDETRYPRLLKIGESIVKHCYGVPLIVVTLASLLRRERDDREWERIGKIKSFADLNKQQNNVIIRALKLSYDKLPSHLKPCFCYLALYPKDFDLHTYNVSYVWSALGLLHEKKNEIEDYGYSYLMKLVSRSLLEEPDAHIHQLFCVCKMHDLLHDLAMSILGDDLSVVTLDKLHDSNFGRHIVWGYEDGDNLKDKKFPPELLKAKKARTFRFSYKMHYISQSFLEGIISHFKRLRILQLGSSWFEKLPESIGKLKHLRYLDLWHNPILRTLPNTICELLNLEYLNFSGCEQLKEIPKDLHLLQSLRFLGVATSQMRLIDTKINQLTSLHTLWIVSCKRLQSLWESDAVGGLTSLRIMQIGDSPKLKSLPNSMKFFIGLRSLKIENCQELDLEKGEGLKGLKNLQELSIRNVPKMKNIPDAIRLASSSLEYLNIEDCGGLVQLPEWLQDFTSLRRINIEDCPNLSSLPSGLRRLHGVKFTVDKIPINESGIVEGPITIEKKPNLKV